MNRTTLFSQDLQQIYLSSEHLCATCAHPLDPFRTAELWKNLALHPAPSQQGFLMGILQYQGGKKNKPKTKTKKPPRRIFNYMST